jgi:hypothetical protein
MRFMMLMIPNIPEDAWMPSAEDVATKHRRARR